MNNEYEDYKKVLFAQYGVKGKKAEKAYQLAWDWGHANGLSEVENYFMDLVDLIK